MLDIWTVSSGGMIAMGLNAVATLINQSGWRTLLWIAETLGALVCIVTYLRTHDLKGMFAWGFTFVVVTALLLTPRVTVVVNDLTRPDRIDRVDHVPVGLAAPLWLLTGIGYSVATMYEDMFHLPDERAYTKTGMMFGSRLMQDSFVMASRDPILQSNFTEYVKNCVIPDIQLNHKYTIAEVMHSADIASIIFSKPSPLRGIYYHDGVTSEFYHCIDITPTLKAALAADAGNGGGTFMYHVARMLPGRADAQTAYSDQLQGAYDYFFGAGKSATDIIKQNVLIAGMRRGFNAYIKSMNDTASLVDIASEQSLMKLRLSHAVSYTIANEVLPQLHTVFLLLAVSIFPVMMLALFVKEMTWNVVKNYLNFMGSLTLWPVMFAIFNFAVNFGTQSSMGNGPTLSNINRLMETSSTTAGIAGWLMMSIPFISFKLFTSLGQNIASAGSYLGNALQSAATSDSAAVATGNYSFNNMSMENINGFKRDTNVVNRGGLVTNQLANGALETITPEGKRIFETLASKFTFDIIGDRHVASAAQTMTRESQAQTQTALDGYNHSVTKNAASLKQFHDQFGNSDAGTLSSLTGVTSSDAKRLQDAMSTADAYMKRTGASTEETYSEAQNKSREMSARASAQIKGGITVFNKGVDLSAGIDGRGSSGSSSQTTESGRGYTDHGRNMTAQEAKTISDGLDVIRNYSVTYNGAHVDNAAAGLMNQISAGINTSDSHYQQYTDSLARTHEFQRMASQTETLSTQARNNYNQEFATWVQNVSPDNAAEILTNPDSPQIREQREQMIAEFMEARMRGTLDAHYTTASAHLSDGMRTVANTIAPSFGAAYDGALHDINQRVSDAKIQTDTRERVGGHVKTTQAKIDENEDLVEQERGGIVSEQNNRKTDYTEAGKDFRVNYLAAELHQTSWSPLQWDSIKDINMNPTNIFKGTYKDYKDKAKEDLEENNE